MKIDFEFIQNNIEKRNYQLIGSGSGRLVYDLDNGYVVKMAKNKRGLAQNKAEYQIASESDTGIFAEVTAVSDDFHYLIMEKAERIQSISEVYRFYKVRNHRELFQLECFRNISKKYNLVMADLKRHTSWGMVKNKPVIIDFGFTKEVSRYYTLF